ncbi:paraquat-inducible protein A [Salinisphaera sp. LB1]|uniref:paraquat-inducible protein A n=1 Tax=Salinisphaera sp. LB1 TaxID=2183911 RepID=UPI000D705C3B|nr:paraquat-inducible protein A [Salinisphaera sp. LB1]AWN17142.1 Paraquat-inducible protein A [Salinisphaera sp. LB1]
MAIACPDCGEDQSIPVLVENTVAECRRCGRLLDQFNESGLSVALAWSWASLLLLLPANLLPLMQVSIGHDRRAGYISSGVHALVAEHWPLLALMFAAFTIVFPFLYVGLITTVLTTLHLGYRPKWVGRLFRYAHQIRLWAMPDVLVLAGMVVFMRTQVQMQSHIEAGGWCLISASVLLILMPHSFAGHRVWRLIAPDLPEPRNESSLSCDVCNLILPLSMEQKRCPRCRRRLYLRKPNALNRTAALVAASYVLYFPAYYYPMSTTVQPNGVQQYTIMQGIRQLVNAGYWELAVIIFTASVLIPMLKLIGLSWLYMSVRYPSNRALVLRTHLARIIHRIGRWSNTDPFIAALMVPMISFHGIANVHLGKAALPFALVVTLTMLASRSFDTRLMWDAAEARS